MKMAVKTSCSIFSSLLFEHLHATCDQEGLLLGDIHVVTKTSISDTEIEQKKESIVYDIQQVVACCSIRFFYDKTGNIIDDKIQELVGSSTKSVIGWYKCRQNSSLMMSYWEKIVHRNLSKRLPKLSASGGLLFGLFTSQTVSQATLMFNHLFSRLQDSEWIPMTVSIENLGMTTSHYKSSSTSNTVEPYNQVAKSYKKEVLDEHGSAVAAVSVNNMSKTMLAKLQELCTQVKTSEQEVVQLQNDIDEVRQRLCAVISASRAYESKDEPQLSDTSEEEPDTPSEVNLIDWSDSNGASGVDKQSRCVSGKQAVAAELQDSFEHIELPPQSDKPVNNDESGCISPCSSGHDSFQFLDDVLHKEKGPRRSSRLRLNVALQSMNDKTSCHHSDTSSPTKVMCESPPPSPVY